MSYSSRPLCESPHADKPSNRSDPELRALVDKVSPDLSGVFGRGQNELSRSIVSTSRGPAVLLSSLGRKQATTAPIAADADSSDEEDGAPPVHPSAEDDAAARSLIAQMLWTRWLLGLKEQRKPFALSGMISGS